MSAFEATRRAAIWAAGGEQAADLRDVPPDMLLAAVRHHRIEGRLLERARREQVSLPEGVQAQLEATHAQILEQVHEQFKLFASVRDAVGPGPEGPGVVAIKGFGLYALTQRPEHASRSNDIDVLGRDAQQLAGAIEATGGSGYHYHGEEHPYVFAHMEKLEVHTRYIVTGMPPGATVESVAAPHDSGRHELHTPFSITSITYADLVRELIDGTGAAAGIGVLRPEIAILVRCAHVFVGFVMETQPLPWATVRLEELAQMRDYLALDLFDAARFRELHARYDAGLVTDFARRLHLDLFGSDPFAEVLGDQPIREWFPRNLWWDGIDAGFPVALPWAPEDLIASAADHVDLADLLGPTKVVLPESGSVTLSVLDPAAADDAERYIFHRYGDGLDFIRLELRESPDGLHTTVRFPPVADGRMAAIGWATGNFRYELFYRPREGTYDFSDYSSVRAVNGPRVESCTSDADGVTLTMELPWPALGLSGRLDQSGRLPLLFRGRVQDRPWGAVAGGAVLPLELLR